MNNKTHTHSSFPLPAHSLFLHTLSFLRKQESRISFSLQVQDSAVSFGNYTASLLRKQAFNTHIRHSCKSRNPTYTHVIPVETGIQNLTFFASTRLSSFVWQLHCFAPAKAGIRHTHTSFLWKQESDIYTSFLRKQESRISFSLQVQDSAVSAGTSPLRSCGNRNPIYTRHSCESRNPESHFLCKYKTQQFRLAPHHFAPVETGIQRTKKV